MNTQQHAIVETTPVREVVGETSQHAALLSRPVVRDTMPLLQQCEDCRALTAFQAWRDTDVGPAFNTSIHFRPWGIPPAGKRAVMALVTATIVPSRDARGAPMALGWPKVSCVRDLIQRLRQWRLCHPLPPSAVVQSHRPWPGERRDPRPTSVYVMLVESDICPDIPWPFP